MQTLLSYDPLKKNRIWILALLIILSIAVFLRLFQLSTLPPGLNQDETAIGYNAYSIAEVGKDEYGQQFPLYFKSFNDYKLPAYIYTVSLLVKGFGLNAYVVRLPSTVAGIVSVLLLYLLIDHLTRNKTLAVFAAFLLSVNPQHVLFSRAAFEVNFALFWVLLGLYVFIVAMEKKRWFWIFASILFFGIAFYSYNVMRLLVPLFVTGLIVLHWPKMKHVPAMILWGLGVLCLIVLVPFLFTMFLPQGAASARDALITSSDVVAKNLEFRSYLIDLPLPFVKLVYNKYVYMGLQYMQNVALLASGAFFYVSGTTQMNQGIGTVGMFYLFELPLFICGIIMYFVQKLKSLRMFFWWLVGCILVLALSKEVPHATRGYFLVIPGVVFSSVGALYLLYRLSIIRRRMVRFGLVFLVGIFVLFTLQYYFTSFFFRFPVVYARAWRRADEELSLYLQKNAPRYDKIIISNDADYIYTSYLFYTQYPPDQFIKNVHRYQDGMLIKADVWSNVMVRHVDWKKDARTPNILIVTSFAEKPEYIPALYSVSDPQKNVFLSIDGQIVSAPEDGVRYVVVDTNRILKSKLPPLK